MLKLGYKYLRNSPSAVMMAIDDPNSSKIVFQNNLNDTTRNTHDTGLSIRPHIIIF